MSRAIPAAGASNWPMVRASDYGSGDERVLRGVQGASRNVLV